MALSGEDGTKGSDRFVSRIDFSSANLDSSWKKFKSQFRVFALAKSMSKLTEEEQIANMLVCMGADSVAIYDQFVYDEEEHARTVANVMSDFDRHFQPVKNVIYERMKFNQIVQKRGQTIHQFITEIQSQADNCEFGAMAGELVRDRIVVGAQDHKLKEYLVDVDELDLKKCIQKAKQYTSSRAQVSCMAQEDNLDVMHTVQRARNSSSYNSNNNNSHNYNSQDDRERKEACFYCARESHPRAICPARESRCNRCKETGHWGRGKACKGKRDKQTAGGDPRTG